MTRYGQIEIERNYYYNLALMQSVIPADNHLPLVDNYFALTAAEMILPALLSLPTMQTIKLLENIIGISFNSSSIQNLAQRVGENFEDEKDELLSELPEGWETLEPDENLIVEADGTMFHERSGYWNEGKMGCIVKTKMCCESETGWKEINRYYFGSVGSLGKFKDEFERSLERLNYEDAEEMIWIGDGAKWIRRLYESYMGENDFLILDYYHAVQHLYSLADAYFGEFDSPQKKKFIDQQKDKLFESPQDFIAGLKRLLRRNNWKRIGKTRKNIILKEIEYFKNNADRMDYADYRRMGFPIGSGIIESACKNVFGARFKLGGQRWKRKRIDRLLSLRIQYLNDELPKTLKTLYLNPNTTQFPITPLLAA